MKLQAWSLSQVSLDDREEFKETLLRILDSGRKLTPMEVAKVAIFLK